MSSIFSIKLKVRIKNKIYFLSNDKNQKHSATNYRTNDTVQLKLPPPAPSSNIHDEQLDSRSPSSALFKEILISESFNVNIKNVIPFYLFMSERGEGGDRDFQLITYLLHTHICRLSIWKHACMSTIVFSLNEPFLLICL